MYAKHLMSFKKTHNGIKKIMSFTNAILMTFELSIYSSRSFKFNINDIDKYFDLSADNINLCDFINHFINCEEKKIAFQNLFL